jgi:dihydroorotate dehydrogenase
MFQQALRSLRRTTFRTIVGGTIAVGTLEVTTHLPSQGRSSEFYHSLADDGVTPLLRRVLNPEQAHHWVLQFLANEDYSRLAPRFRPSAVEQRLDVSSTIGGRLPVSNPIGLAAGFDKDGVAIEALLNLGFGFVEIGSVTLKPQPGNPSPRMFRLVDDDAIINSYGFNSLGADVVEEHLKAYREKQKQQQQQARTTTFSIQDILWGKTTTPTAGLVGVNLGKNKESTTPIEDYQALIRQLGPYADYLVINVSSPNTPGLRELQAASSLETLLKACLEARDELQTKNAPPLLVKLSPDLSDSELQEIAKVLLDLRMDGIIVTNTTTQRPASLLSDKKSEPGGLSGRPLNQRSTECIANLYQWTDGSIPIIGVGGIFDTHDVYEKICAGASVVQIYSGMVYQGPGLVSKLRHDLATLLLQNGHRRLQDVVGIQHEDLYWQKKRNKAAMLAQQQQQQDYELYLSDSDVGAIKGHDHEEEMLLSQKQQQQDYEVYLSESDVGAIEEHDEEEEIPGSTEDAAMESNLLKQTSYETSTSLALEE